MAFILGVPPVLAGQRVLVMPYLAWVSADREAPEALICQAAPPRRHYHWLPKRHS